jgi:predicted ribosome quality control (RQC) complex YloA/Tae2 family protein
MAKTKADLEREIETLEQEVEHQRERAEYYKRQAEFQKEKVRLILEAWSVVHPVDLVWMEENSPDGQHIDLYNHIIYEFGRALPDGRTSTRYSSYELAERYRREQFDKAVAEMKEAKL